MIWLPAIAAAAGVPLALTVRLTPFLSTVYVLLSAVGGSQIGPLYAFLQSTVKVRMRATTMSIAYAVQNFVGIGMGALVVGIISDHLKSRVGTDSLRFAMAWASSLYLLAAGCYVRAAAGMPTDRTQHGAAC